MHRRMLLAATFAAPLLRSTAAQAATELVVHYPMPAFLKDVMEQLAAEFTRANPDVTVRFPAPSPTYEDAVQQVVRQSAAGGLPDVSFQGLNRLRFLADRGILVDLGPFLAKVGDTAAAGWTPGILQLAQVGGKQVGLTFSASNPIVYYNAKLVQRAGGDPDRFPTDWDDVLKLSAAIAGLGDGISGMFYRWPGDDWMFSALLYGYGGHLLSTDEKTVSFNGPEGLAALRLLDRMVKEGRMPPLTTEAAFQAFYAGKLGMIMGTTAYIGQFQRSIGPDVELWTARMPVITPGGKLPTGGNAVVMLTRDPARQDAAWRFMQFAAGPVGQTIMVRGTGYVPSNTLTLDDRYLGSFYRENPLFRPAMEQIPIMQPWYAFPGSNGVRITQAIVDNLARIVEQRATPEVVLADVTAEVQRRCRGVEAVMGVAARKVLRHGFAHGPTDDLA